MRHILAAVAAITLAVGAYHAPAASDIPQRCWEDMECFDCTTMGNGRCEPLIRGGAR